MVSVRRGLMYKIRISFLCNFIAIFVATFELKASSSRGFLARVPRAGSSRGFLGRVHGAYNAQAIYGPAGSVQKCMFSRHDGT